MDVWLVVEETNGCMVLQVVEVDCVFTTDRSDESESQEGWANLNRQGTACIYEMLVN